MTEYATKAVHVGERTYLVTTWRGRVECIEVMFSTLRRGRFGLRGDMRTEFRRIWHRTPFAVPPAGKVARAAAAAAGAQI